MQKKGGASLTPDDEKIWQEITKSVTPLKAGHRRKPKSPAIKPAPAKTGKTPRGPSSPPAQPRVTYTTLPGQDTLRDLLVRDLLAGKTIGGSNPGFDRATETKLKKGQLPIAGRIDLHGMTQERAYHALIGFIRRAVADEKRTVLVITGKGAKGEGILRRMVPLWLEEQSLKKHVVAVTTAAAKDGGTGALYIRLKKQR